MSLRKFGMIRFIFIKSVTIQNRFCVVSVYTYKINALIMILSPLLVLCNSYCFIEIFIELVTTMRLRQSTFDIIGYLDYEVLYFEEGCE